MYNPELQRRKGGVSSKMTRLGQQMWNYRRNTARSCFGLSESYILQYIWWVGNTTWISSSEVWICSCWGFYTSQMKNRLWSSDTNRWTKVILSVTKWNRNEAFWCFWEALRTLYFGRKWQFSLQTFISLMRRTFWRSIKWNEYFHCNFMTGY